MIKQDLQIGSEVSGYKVVDIQEVNELNVIVYQFEHSKTKAKALHLYCDDKNNLFSIAFKTPVSDNTGVPHILEHSVLAGSKKYPLKDPFKELLKSSMQTFLNAVTYPDRTLYPVSSQVENDFFNLVDIYCDAVFNPLLTENTFKQEGWHFDLEDLSDPVSIKGIVYNEMKGVFSDFQSHVGRKMLSGLFPDTTYFFESGGEPEHIPELTYEAFKEFHATFYHPSNSFTILYGDIPSEKTLSYIDKEYLSNFEYKEVNSEVKSQSQWDKPRNMEIVAPAPKENDGTATVLVNWMWPGTTDGIEGLTCDILTRYLFNGESAPLKRALIDSGLGEDLDDMCGYDNDLNNAFFSAGLSKAKPEDADKIEKIILDTLQNQIENGLDDELLEGAIRRIEFKLREIRKGGHFPYPLRLAEGIYRSWLYGGDPLTHIAFEKALDFIKAKKAEKSGYFEKKLKELTIDNPHRLTMVTKASSQLGEELGKLTEKQAEALSENFTEEDRKRIYNETKELLAHQKREHTEEELSCIPQLSTDDIPKKNDIRPIEKLKIGDNDLYVHDIFTAGIFYIDIKFDLSVLTEEQLFYYPLYAEFFTRCGAGDYSTEEMAKRVNLYTGGITVSDIVMEDIKDLSTLNVGMFLHGKSLESTTDKLLEILADRLLRPNFKDEKLLKNILLESRNDILSSIARSGHSYGMLSSSSRLLLSKSIEEKIDGIGQYRFLKDLVEKDDVASILDVITEIHTTLINREGVLVSITADQPKRFIEKVEAFISQLPSFIPLPNEYSFERSEPKKVAVEISSSVNYVTQSWLLPDLDPTSVGEYFLMGRILSTGFLWDKVRVEGGAYGGMAVASNSHPVFSFASYRDPNFTETLDNYVKALKYMVTSLTEEDVQRAISGTIGKLDIPKSPHTLGLGETINTIVNNSVEDRQKMRDAIITCSAEKIKDRARFLLDTISKSEITVLAATASIEESKDSIEELIVEKV